jgi:hypothetical protein
MGLLMICCPHRVIYSQTLAIEHNQCTVAPAMLQLRMKPTAATPQRESKDHKSKDIGRTMLSLIDHKNKDIGHTMLVSDRP